MTTMHNLSSKTKSKQQVLLSLHAIILPFVWRPRLENVLDHSRAQAELTS